MTSAFRGCSKKDKLANLIFVVYKCQAS